jgi:hypothetical protein
MLTVSPVVPPIGAETPALFVVIVTVLGMMVTEFPLVLSTGKKVVTLREVPAFTLSPP